MNVTDSAAPLSQQRLLEDLLPGFPIVSSFFSHYLGINLSLYLGQFLVLGALLAAIKYCNEAVTNLAKKYIVSSVEIFYNDDLFEYLLSYIADHPLSRNSRRLIAQASYQKHWKHSDGIGADEGFVLENNQIQAVARCKPPVYAPGLGDHVFRYKGRFILLTRALKSDKHFSNHEHLRLSCFGRNPALLKEIITEAQADQLKRDRGQTIIYTVERPSSPGDAPTWARCLSRPHRLLATVVLDEALKKDLICDIADYCHPASNRWYSNRGIPYRRGYMFHGPPGTGKSSLCLALAGYFGLRIYMLNLGSRFLTEDGLSALFQRLPRRCILLLEDVDTAGVMTAKRIENASAPAESSPVEANADKEQGGDAMKSMDPAPRISLSALLNVIDGVASSEGRILVMTTNHLQRLDGALLRPGRVDMLVEFKHASRKTIYDLFYAIYCPVDGDLPIKQSSDRGEKEDDQDTLGAKWKDGEIQGLADRFASILPEGKLSPAEIQGFLLKYKLDPVQAVADAEGWVAQQTRLKGST